MRTKTQVILDEIHVWYVVKLLPQCFANCLSLMKESKGYFYIFGDKSQKQHTNCSCKPARKRHTDHELNSNNRDLSPVFFTRNFKHCMCNVQSHLSIDFVNCLQNLLWLLLDVCIVMFFTDNITIQNYLVLQPQTDKKKANLVHLFATEV